MNQFGYVHFEVEKSGRKYIFCAPIGAPLDEACDAAFEVLQKIRELQKNQAEQAKKQQDETKQSENIPVELVSKEPNMQ